MPNHLRVIKDMPALMLLLIGVLTQVSSSIHIGHFPTSGSRISGSGFPTSAMKHENTANISCKCIPLFVPEICKDSQIRLLEKRISDPDICCLGCSVRSMYEDFCVNGTVHDKTNSPMKFENQDRASCRELSHNRVSQRIRRLKGFGMCMLELDSLCPVRKVPNNLGLHHLFQTQRMQLRRQFSSRLQKSTMATIPTLPPRVTRFSYQ